MSEEENNKRKEGLLRRAEELKAKAFEEESQRLERVMEEGGRELAKARLSQDEIGYARRLQEAQEYKRKEEEALRVREQDVLRKLEADRLKKIEARRREELQRKRQEEEEKQRLEAVNRLQKEEEQKRELERVRLQRAEERAKQEETVRKEAEQERLRQEDELRRKEGERRRRDADVLDKQVERQERIQSLMASAETFLKDGDYEHASVEVAKALVNDPANPRALELEQTIKEKLGTGKEKVNADKAKRKKRRRIMETAPPIARKQSRSATIMIAIVLGCLIIGAVVLMQLNKSASPTTFSLVVFPWHSASDDSEENIIGAALAEELTARLEQLKSTGVMGFSSAYRLAHHSKEPERAALGLGYRYAIHGTIGRSSSGFSILVRLLDSLGNSVWSHQYEKTAEALPGLAVQIAQQIMQDVPGIPVESSGALVAHHTTTNPDAYLAYLRGLEMLQHRTDETTQNALTLFKDAVRRDGAFAEALAAAASVTAIRWEQGWDIADSLLPIAKQLAEDAIAANSLAEDGYSALGNVLAQRKDYSSSLQQFDAAITRCPNCVDAIIGKAKVLFKIGKYKDALNAFARAYELNPRDADVLTTFALAYQLMGKTHQGNVYLQTAISCVDDSTDYIVGPFADAVLLDPDLSLSQSDRVADACERRLAVHQQDYGTAYRLARLLQVTGKAIEATERLGKLEALLRSELQLHPKNAHAMIYLALTLTRLGKFPEATALALKASNLEKASPELKYKIAQMYSLQMYSQKEKKIDEKKRDEAISALRDAIGLRYRFDELANADFYNIFEQAEFSSLIKETL